MSYAGYDPASQAPPPWPPQAPAQGRGPSRLLPILGAVLGLLGLIAGVAAWFRAAPSNVGEGPVYSEQQVADAKKAVCDAYAKGVQSIQAAVAKRPENPAETLLPATVLNARIAEVTVANYLFTSIDANPAAPPELSGLIRKLGDIYQNIVLTQLADGAREEVGTIAAKADEVMPTIGRICQ